MPIYLKISLDDICDEDVQYDSELGADYSASVKELIISEITYRSKEAIMKIIREKTEAEVQKRVKERIESDLNGFVKGVISSKLSKITIKGNYSNDPEVPLNDYIIDKFKSKVKKNDFDMMLSNIVDSYVKTIRSRFDKLFAAQFLDKLMKVGLLKDDRISKLLTADEESE